MQADVHRLSALLEHVEWAAHHGTHLPEIVLRNTQERYQGRALRSQLSVLPALRFAPTLGTDGLPAGECTPRRAQLCGWSITENVMEALPQLPAWGPCLVFGTTTTWPLPAVAYKRLASLIPTSYTTSGGCPV